MKKNILIYILLILSIKLYSQNNEYYLSIKIENRSDIEMLTQIVSIDNVKGNNVIAYANDKELEELKTTDFLFEMLEHPSNRSSKAVTMATTVQDMANWNRYPTYDVYNQLMVSIANNYPELCKLDTLGTSVNNRNILVLQITSNISENSPKPEVLFSSTMHGDELTGWILCMRLADYLLSNYGKVSRITDMLDSTSIFIAPNTNPDGTYYAGNTTVINSRRYNYNSKDLNRIYPDPRVGISSDNQKENFIMMDFAEARNFILAINYHGGAELINYPWDTWTSYSNTHADNDWFVKISRQYATFLQNNGHSGYFDDENSGITNGGDWYVITGGRQDYMNYWHHCREVTLEVSSTKLLDSEQLPNYWNYNREAMLTFIENVNYGIRGFVTNSEGEPLEATITVVGHDKDNSFVVTNPEHGNYYRMINPGTYTLKFDSYGYDSQIITNVVVSENEATYLNVTLDYVPTYFVSGIALNAQNGQPISDVKVTLNDTPLTPVYTDSNGYFSCAGIEESEIEINFSKEGYINYIQTIDINENIINLYVIMNMFDGSSFEDGDIPESFTFSGNSQWLITYTESFDGQNSIRSGEISDNQTSTMTYSVDCEKAGDFYYYAKISSEAGGYDYLEFFIDGASKGRWSGEIDWKKYTFPVNMGQHTFRWTYSKDYSMSSGSDAVWVDFISVPKNTTPNPIPIIIPRPFKFETSERTGSRDITIKNIGSGTLNFEASIENDETNWFSLSNNAGELPQNESSVITMNYSFDDLAYGIFSSIIKIDVTDSIMSIPVEINIINPIPLVTPHYFVIETENRSGSETIRVQNTGNGILEFSATVENNEETGWIALSENTGSLSHDESTEILVEYDLHGLDSGLYETVINIEVPDSVISIPVSINCTYSGIETHHSDLFDIYPNPANDNISIMLKGHTDSALMDIYTITGNKLYSTQLKSNNTTLNISDLGISNKGIFLIKIKTGSNLGVLKLIIN